MDMTDSHLYLTIPKTLLEPHVTHKTFTAHLTHMEKLTWPLAESYEGHVLCIVLAAAMRTGDPSA